MSEDTISIGELEALRAAMTPGNYQRGEWDYRTKTIQPSPCNGNIVSDAGYEQSVISGCGCCGSPDALIADADGLIAEHNAIPALIAIAKAAREALGMLDDPNTGWWNLEGADSRARLRAALSKVRP